MAARLVRDEVLEAERVPVVVVVVRTYVERRPRRELPEEKVLIVTVEPDPLDRCRCPQCGQVGRRVESEARCGGGGRSTCTASGASWIPSTLGLAVAVPGVPHHDQGMDKQRERDGPLGRDPDAVAGLADPEKVAGGGERLPGRPLRLAATHAESSSAMVTSAPRLTSSR